MKLDVIQEKTVTVKVEPMEAVQALIDNYGFTLVKEVNPGNGLLNPELVLYKPGVGIHRKKTSPLTAEICKTMLKLRALLETCNELGVDPTVNLDNIPQG